MNDRQQRDFVPGDNFWKHLLVFRNFCVKDKYIWHKLFGDVEHTDYSYAFSFIDTTLDWYHEHLAELKNSAADES